LDLGYLQKQVAAKIGVHKTTIANWERQRNQPELRFIAPIIEFLGYSPFPEPADLPGRIILFRTRQGLSQERFASKLGIDPSTLAGWETGRHSPTAASLALLREAGIL